MTTPVPACRSRSLSLSLSLLRVVVMTMVVSVGALPTVAQTSATPAPGPASGRPVRSAPAGGGRTVPAEPHLEELLAGMKAWPLGQAVRERYRVIGTVRSSGTEGVLLEKASVREWQVDEVIVGGGVTRKYGPGAALAIQGGLAFVTGIQARPGQKLTADVHASGTRDLPQGSGRVRVRVFKSAGLGPAPGR